MRVSGGGRDERPTVRKKGANRRQKPLRKDTNYLNADCADLTNILISFREFK